MARRSLRRPPASEKTVPPAAAGSTDERTHKSAPQMAVAKKIFGVLYLRYKCRVPDGACTTRSRPQGREAAELPVLVVDAETARTSRPRSAVGSARRRSDRVRLIITCTAAERTASFCRGLSYLPRVALTMARGSRTGHRPASTACRKSATCWLKAAGSSRLMVWPLFGIT